MSKYQSFTHWLRVVKRHGGLLQHYKLSRRFKVISSDKYVKNTQVLNARKELFQEIYEIPSFGAKLEKAKLAIFFKETE
jgi:hypothetical protein